MSTTKTYTPETDAESRWAMDFKESAVVVESSFARRFELERDRLKTQWQTACQMAADAARERDEWKASHDHVCAELAACENARDENAAYCEEARRERDELAELLRCIDETLATIEGGIPDQESLAIAMIRGEIARLDPKPTETR